MPYYYDMTPGSTGVFRLRHLTREGHSVYATEPGWSLDMTQSYNTIGSLDTIDPLPGASIQRVPASSCHVARAPGAKSVAGVDGGVLLRGVLIAALSSR